MIIAWPDMGSAGTKTVKLVYNEKEYSFNVKLVKPQQTTYEVFGYKDTYYVGDTFDPTGMKLRINYNDGNSEVIEITSNMISCSMNTPKNNAEAYVLYKGKWYTFYVTVLEAE